MYRFAFLTTTTSQKQKTHEQGKQQKSSKPTDRKQRCIACSLIIWDLGKAMAGVFSIMAGPWLVYGLPMEAAVITRHWDGDVARSRALRRHSYLGLALLGVGLAVRQSTTSTTKEKQKKDHTLIERASSQTCCNTSPVINTKKRLQSQGKNITKEHDDTMQKRLICHKP